MLFTFQNNNGYFELMLGQIEEHSLNGWSIYPHRYPIRVNILFITRYVLILIIQIDQSDVDMYGSQDPPYFPSILITVSVENGPNTVTKLNYCLPVNVIKPDNTKIVVVRSCSNTGKS